MTQARKNTKATAPKKNTLALKRAPFVALVFTLVLGSAWLHHYLQDPDTPRTQRTSAAETATPQNKGQTGLKTGTKTSTHAPLDSPKAQNDSQNPFTGVEAKARLQQVAARYAQDIKYPDFSKPILQPEALEKYLPNRSTESRVSLEPSVPDSPSITLKTERQQYFPGEVIYATASLKHLSPEQHYSLSGKLVSKGVHVAEAHVDALDPLAHRYALSIKLDAVEQLDTGQLRLLVSATLPTRTLTAGSPVTVAKRIAQVSHVEQSQVYQDYLQIPVAIQTDKPGYHQLSAILFSAETDTPLVLLSAQAELLTESAYITLRAHISALTALGDPGPYSLQQISLIRMPSAPDFVTEYGGTTASSFPVDGHAFEQYDNRPYEDEAAQDRLKFLRDLAQTQP